MAERVVDEALDRLAHPLAVGEALDVPAARIEGETDAAARRLGAHVVHGLREDLGEPQTALVERDLAGLRAGDAEKVLDAQLEALRPLLDRGEDRPRIGAPGRAAQGEVAERLQFRLGECRAGWVVGLADVNHLGAGGDEGGQFVEVDPPVQVLAAANQGVIDMERLAEHARLLP